MLAERTVRRLSIRAPADALARRAGFLIEDALRTASLPGDGAELLLLRRAAAAAVRRPRRRRSRWRCAWKPLCRAAIAVDGTLGRRRGARRRTGRAFCRCADGPPRP
jgi:hypothetical protein